MKLIQLLILIYFLIFFQNCATYITSGNWEHGTDSKIYSRTIFNASVIISAGKIEPPWVFLFPLAIVDFPFSLVADTIILPYTGYLTFQDSKISFRISIDLLDKKIINNFKNKYPNYDPLIDSIQNKDKEIFYKSIKADLELRNVFFDKIYRKIKYSYNEEKFNDSFKNQIILLLIVLHLGCESPGSRNNARIKNE